MSRVVERQVGSFLARFVDGGQTIGVNIFARFEEGHTSSGPYSVEGTRRMETEDGQFVQRESRGCYTVIDDDGTEYGLESDDPNAP